MHTDSKLKIGWGFMDTFPGSEKHKDYDLFGFGGSEIEKFLIPNEAESLYGAFGPLLY